MKYYHTNFIPKLYRAFLNINEPIRSLGRVISYWLLAEKLLA